MQFETFSDKDKVIRSDVTDAWYDPCPEVISTITNHLPWLIKNSPPVDANGLIHTISNVRNIPPHNILVGNGSSDIMFTLFQHVGIRSAVILDPMYNEYAHILQHILNIPFTRIKQKESEHFAIDIEPIISAGQTHDAVILVNPNNPTGQHLTKKKVTYLLNRLPKTTLLIIDESYIEYVGTQESMEQEVQHHDNLIIIKSMSKTYALSGLRVGYLVASQPLIEKLSKFQAPWSVNMLAQIAGMIALQNQEYAVNMIQTTHKLRESLMQGLHNIGLTTIPSKANFFLVKLSKHINAQRIVDSLAAEKIFIRNPDNQSTQFYGNYIRISVKDQESNTKIIEALTKAVEQYDKE
ncbi:histidinol-phosphate aminotransferase family protein [Candidatus Woesearchaeota archaeon]|nr:histidinol-phosphate aminotransferase family protein [Candidatus Woesearchaeota archaeon]